MDCVNEDDPNDPFYKSKIMKGNRYSHHFPMVSRYYANVNLKKTRDYWNFREWNPDFGDINDYTIRKLIGSGRYSEVFIGTDKLNNKCAIKVLKPVNNDRVRREMRILSIVQGHPNILKLIDIVIDKYSRIPSMITEYVHTIDFRILFRTFSLEDIRFYIYRILQSLSHTHKLGIMHRDVKPVNVLCANPKRKIKLADWGLSEFYHPMHMYSSRVCTRYYKAPELLVGYGYYNYSVDIWSTGVILLELLTDRVHFFDTDDVDHILYMIADIFSGQTIINWINKYRIKTNNIIITKLKRIKGKGLESCIPFLRGSYKDPAALDLLGKMMWIDHKERISADEALMHPFFQVVREYDNLNSPIETPPPPPINVNERPKPPPHIKSTESQEESMKLLSPSVIL